MLVCAGICVGVCAQAYAGASVRVHVRMRAYVWACVPVCEESPPFPVVFFSGSGPDPVLKPPRQKNFFRPGSLDFACFFAPPENFFEIWA